MRISCFFLIGLGLWLGLRGVSCSGADTKRVKDLCRIFQDLENRSTAKFARLNLTP